MISDIRKQIKLNQEVLSLKDQLKEIIDEVDYQTKTYKSLVPNSD